MPTIFERLSTGMQGDGLSLSITLEAGKLTDAAGKLSGLIANPPSSVGDLMQGVADVALPVFDVSGLSAGIGSLAQAVPSNASDFGGGVTGALGALKVDVATNFAAKLERFIKALQALQKLGEAGSLFQSASGAKPAPAVAAPASGGGSGAGSGTGSPAPGGTPATVDDATAAARQRRLEAVNQVNGVLDRSTPFDAPGLVVFLHAQLAALPRDNVKLRRLPYFDDLLFLLSTSIALREKDAAGLKVHLHDTLENLAAFLGSAADWPAGAFASRLQVVAAVLDCAALRAETETLAASLRAVGSRVAAGDAAGAAPDIATANAALDTLLPRLAVLNTGLFDGQVDAVTRAFRRLPVDLDRQMRRVVQSVKPGAGMQMLGVLGDELRAHLALPDGEGIADDLGVFLDRVVNTLRMVDLGPVQGPLLEATQALNTAADGIDQALSGVASQASLAFNELDTCLAAIDTVSLMAEIESAIEGFGRELETRMGALFAPVRDAISQAVTEISDALSSFDPSQIADALKDVVKKLTDVLDAPEVKNAIETIRGAIETAAQQLKSLSFTPVTGAVIDEIDSITAMLKKIDPATLSTPTKLALTGAVAILPGDLGPVTTPLESEFGALVDAGPKPLLTQVADAPARLLGEVKKYSPDKLIGDELGKPMAALVAELEKFKPSNLLAPVNEALGGLKEQLKRNANPGLVLAPVEDVFNNLMSAIDQLNPAQLAEVLDRELKQAIDEVVTALPADEVVDVLDRILGAVDNVKQFAVGVKSALEKARALVAGLSDAESQIRDWYAPVLAAADGLDEVASLQPSFDKVSAAVNRLKATALAATVDAVAGPLRAGLNDLDPGASLANLGTAYRAVSPASLAALPASAGKDAIVALLARFNPVDATFGRPYEGLERWRADLDRDAAAYAGLLQYWDRRFHEPGGALADYVCANVTKAGVRALLADAAENDVVKPLARLVGFFDVYGQTLDAPLQKITAFVDAFEAKVNELLTGPASLGGVRDAFAQLVVRLRAIDVQFLVRDLDALFGSVKGKLTAVSPTALRTVVETTFNEALDKLDLSQLLPASEMAAIDAAYAKIIEDLKKLDPKKLVIDAVQPEFDNTVLPLLQAFDISVLIKALIERLDVLKGELGTELGRANTSYQAMLDAVPTMSLTDISLDIGVDLGF